MAKLYYFDGRGRGEIVRLALAAADIPFEEELLRKRDDFLKLVDEGRLLFHQIPLLEIDGKNIVQVNAIVHYIAKKAGLYGKNLDEEVLIDQYYEGARDFMFAFLPIGFAPEKDVLEGPAKKALSKYLPIFEKIASENGSGFLVGKTLSMADVSLLEVLLTAVEYLGIEVLEPYPAVHKLYNGVSSIKQIAAFLKGPQRKRKNDERYVGDVKHILQWE
ncbi:unnamed protein product [Candidula unifasciata]|uniref:Glutathione transferase n=1 Tax=Candidula unifasciata TaxID=100452 RepID=A0A8S3ZAX9_9EUPU|nr:unnamed protein product [Candidula unifasciata]